jgi:hypothetical protein
MSTPSFSCVFWILSPPAPPVLDYSSASEEKDMAGKFPRPMRQQLLIRFDPYSPAPVQFLQATHQFFAHKTPVGPMEKSILTPLRRVL